LCSSILAILHLAIVLLSIFFWVEEGRPNLEFVISLLAFIVLIIGFIGATKLSPVLLLVFIVGLSVFLLLEILGLLIGVVYLFLALFGIINVITGSAVGFSFLSLSIILLNCLVIVVMMISIQSAWKLRKLILRSRFSVVSTADGDYPMGETSAPYEPPEMVLTEMDEKNDQVL